MAEQECPFCGEMIKEAARKCRHCGEFLDEELRAEREPSKDITQDPAMRALLPVGRSIWAIVAGYLGLLAIIPLFHLFAILFGVLAILDIRKHPDRGGMGRAIFGIVMGALFTFLYGLAFVA